MQQSPNLEKDALKNVCSDLNVFSLFLLMCCILSNVTHTHTHIYAPSDLCKHESTGTLTWISSSFSYVKHKFTVPPLTFSRLWILL